MPAITGDMAVRARCTESSHFSPARRARLAATAAAIPMPPSPMRHSPPHIPKVRGMKTSDMMSRSADSKGTSTRTNGRTEKLALSTVQARRGLSRTCTTGIMQCNCVRGKRSAMARYVLRRAAQMVVAVRLWSSEPASVALTGRSNQDVAARVSFAHRVLTSHGAALPAWSWRRASFRPHCSRAWGTRECFMKEIRPPVLSETKEQRRPLRGRRRHSASNAQLTTPRRSSLNSRSVLHRTRRTHRCSEERRRA